MACRAARRRAIEAAEYRPCFVRAFLMRSMPSAVLAPVEAPPCTLHRPFGIAADRQGVPLPFVLAPQRGALPGLPGVPPCFSQPMPGKRAV